jgi:hypothetical protein
MRKWLAWIFPCLLLFPFSAQAQSSLTLDSLKISLWPEYDQPSMLVIYDFKLPADTKLPVSLKILIPKDANLTAVAYQQGNNYMNTEFSGPGDEDNQQAITIPIKELKTYHVEYYEPLSRDGNNRSFNYQWLGEYAVNNLKVEVQVPEDSTALKTTPALPFVPNQNFLTGSVSVGSLKQGDVYRVQLNYARTSEATSVQSASAQVTASESITQKTFGRVTLNNLPYILGTIGILLILGAAFYFWRSTSLPELAKGRKRPLKTQSSGAQIYCHECGTRANPEDRFCRVCGTKLRAS